LLFAVKRVAKVRFLFSILQIFFQDFFSQLIHSLIITTVLLKDLFLFFASFQKRSAKVVFFFKLPNFRRKKFFSFYPLVLLNKQRVFKRSLCFPYFVFEAECKGSVSF
jgi:hypothetical protein